MKQVSAIVDNKENKLVQKMFHSQNIWKLNQKYKEKMVLLYYSNLSIKEIDCVLNIIENNTKVRLKELWKNLTNL